MDAIASYYLIFKAIHVIFMVTWFAGLFYLPRLFIYHCEASDDAGRERFGVMEKRLFAIMTIGAGLTFLSGAILIAVNTAIVDAHWFQIKLGLVTGLAIYHYRCYAWIRRLRGAETTSDTRWLRWFNEIPALFLISIVLLAIAKPF